MNTTIEFQTELSRKVLPATSEPQLLYVLVTAMPQGTPATITRLPLNISLVIDRSSSMRGERLEQVKEGAIRLIDRLSPDDYFSLITFNDRAEVVIPAQSVGEKAVILKGLIREIDAEGGTEMATGLKLGLQEIQRALLLNGMKRIIILTDGQTYGDEARCIDISRHAQDYGIGLTTLGIGDDWNEDLLEVMTSRENSHTHYITSAYEIPEVFAQEVRRMHSIFAQNVQMLVEARSDATLRSFDRVQPYIASVPFKGERDLRWVGRLGDWPGVDEQAFLLEVVVPPLGVGEHPLLQLTVRYDLPARSLRNQKTEISVGIPLLPMDRVSPGVNGSVKVWLERLIAYRLQAKAWKNVETGFLDEAVSQLTMAGTRLLESGEAELARTLQEEASRLRKSGKPSNEGRKRIKYGTRGLIKAPIGERVSEN